MLRTRASLLHRDAVEPKTSIVLLLLQLCPLTYTFLMSKDVKKKTNPS